MAILEDIKNAIIEMDPDLAVELVGKAAGEGIPALDIVNGGLIPGISVVGERFKSFEYFLPEVIVAANAFKASFELLAPALDAGGYEPKGRVLIGTVAGDNHDIGKNIVIALLRGNGYEVEDAGVDITPEMFVELVKEKKPNVLGMSALLTTTMANMRETVTALKGAGVREGLKVIIGGSCVSDEFAKNIGADAGRTVVAPAEESAAKCARNWRCSRRRWAVRTSRCW